MEKTNEEYSLLYDFYGELLSWRQREVFSLYYEENLSLSEIAENIGISRQAVHITLGKANRDLETYEKNLRLIEKHAVFEKQLEEILRRMDAILKDKERVAGIDPDTVKDLKRVKKLIKGIEI